MMRAASDARVALRLAQDNENRLWLQYQALANSAPDLQVKMIDGAAKIITAAICKVTHGQPRGVCASAGVTAASRSLG
jgi:hypothetical protein